MEKVTVIDTSNVSPFNHKQTIVISLFKTLAVTVTWNLTGSQHWNEAPHASPGGFSVLYYGDCGRQPSGSGHVCGSMYPHRANNNMLPSRPEMGWQTYVLKNLLMKIACKCSTCECTHPHIHILRYTCMVTTNMLTHHAHTYTYQYTSTDISTHINILLLYYHTQTHISTHHCTCIHIHTHLKKHFWLEVFCKAPLVKHTFLYFSNLLHALFQRLLCCFLFLVTCYLMVQVMV